MIRPPGQVMYAALHGRNIPGAPTLTEAKVRATLQRLPASMTYLRIVGRPDSILIGVSGTTTEEDVRRAVSAAVGCRCVVISTTLASRIVDGAVAALRTLGAPVTPPYRITTEGTEWEWCLVLSSDATARRAGQYVALREDADGSRACLSGAARVARSEASVHSEWDADHVGEPTARSVAEGA